MRKVSNLIGSVEKLITIILMAAITIVLFCNVIFRYFLKVPIIWANEASIFMMSWVTCLGGRLSLKNKSQASITFLVSQFTDNKRSILNSMTHIVILASCGFF